MLIPFFNFDNNHIEGPKSQVSKSYCKAKGQACEFLISPEKAEKVSCRLCRLSLENV